MCLCYGNELYTPAAKTVFGAVGCPPINTQEEIDAWSAYVRTTTSHFKGRVHYYEIWNEPDGKWCWKHGINAEELSAFSISTAKACKQGDPDCEVIGFATCHIEEDFHKVLCDNGVLDHLDAISYHSYLRDDELFAKYYKYHDNIRKTYKPEPKVIQGECGAQSSAYGKGALAHGAWTQTKQSKYLLRHLLTDLALGVEWTSYFSCMDMAEALTGTVGVLPSIRDFGYFGVVAADFDENARATGNYRKKPSYVTLQTLCSVFFGDYETVEFDVESVSERSYRMFGTNYDFGEATKYLFRRQNNSAALVYWNPKNILTETYDGETSFKIKSEGLSEDICMVDMLDGSIYELDSNHFIIKDGHYYFRNVPITDSPLLIMFGAFDSDNQSEQA